MYREEKRREERDRLVRSMAGKLATGNGIELIAAARRKKKLPTYLYVTASVALFVITGLILFFHAPEEIELKLNNSNSDVKKVTMVQLMRKDLDDRKITVNQYAFYLRDILVRYDSLPQNYRTTLCDVQTQDIYDSICTTWSKLSNKTKAQLLKELPKLALYLKEYQDKKSFNEK